MNFTKNWIWFWQFVQGCVYMSGATKKNFMIFGAFVWRGHPFLRLQRNFRKIQRKICLRAIFAFIWGRMVKLTYRLHQIATFLLLFPKTPILSTFDAIMAIWLHGHKSIMASNSYIGIWPLWHRWWPLWMFSETAIKMWQSGEDGNSIWLSCLK